jgi:phosphoribosylformimino-5-aminoimidazole carboxamide ribonucleotide (ProFAR) isomerase
MPNISGAIVGRALFDRSYTIKEALGVGSQQLHPTAQFM